MDIISSIRAFARVMERQGISAAARDLGLAQPTVSERLARLEEHLGVRLIQRTARSLVPTEVGHAYYEKCKKVLSALEESESVLPRNAGSLSGKLRVAAPHILGDSIIPKVLRTFSASHPNVDVELVLNDNIVDPVAEGVDLSLRLGESSIGSNIFHNAGIMKNILVASPEYLKGHPPIRGPESLAEHSFLRVGDLHSNEAILLLRDGEPHAFPIETRWRVNSWHPLRALLLMGAGCGVLHAPVAEDHIRNGELVQLLPEYSVPGHRIRIIYPNARPIPLKTRMAVSLIRTTLIEEFSAETP